MRIQLHGKTRIAVVVAVVLALGAATAAAYWLGGIAPQRRSDEAGEFLLVEAADKSLDGSPALALTFSLPLDARKSYDRFVQVFEMPAPPRPAARGQNVDNDDEEFRQG